MKKINLGLTLGFVALLLLLLLIGGAGVHHINVLTDKISILGSQHFPKQKAIVNMKNVNGLYAAGVRNYVSWKLSKYLDAARFSISVGEVEQNIASFRVYVDKYVESADTQQEKEWGAAILLRHKQTAAVGKRVLNTVNRSVRLGKEDANRNKIQLLLLTFENEIYKINQFIEENIERQSLADIDLQIKNAEQARVKRIRELSLGLCIAFLLGTVVAAYVLRRLYIEQMRRELLVNHMVCAEERERQNLSFQVHNQMGQDLSALKIYFGLIEKKTGKSQELEDSKKIVERLIERMHNVSELLCPPELEELGFAAMLEGLIQQYSRLMEAEFNLKVAEDLPQLSTENGLALYRVVQEALTNILKHAQAKKVDVAIEILDQKAVVSIADNGCGFDTSVLKNILRLYRDDGVVHMGLLSLKERIEILNGEMTIFSNLGEGTVIKVLLPLGN